MKSITPELAGCIICTFNSLNAVEEASETKYTEDSRIFQIYSEYTDGKKHIGLKITESLPLKRTVLLDMDDLDSARREKTEAGEVLILVFKDLTLTLRLERKV